MNERSMNELAHARLADVRAEACAARRRRTRPADDPLVTTRLMARRYAAMRERLTAR